MSAEGAEEIFQAQTQALHLTIPMKATQGVCTLTVMSLRDNTLTIKHQHSFTALTSNSLQLSSSIFWCTSNTQNETFFPCYAYQYQYSNVLTRNFLSELQKIGCVDLSIHISRGK